MKNFPENEKFPPLRPGAHEEDSAPLLIDKLSYAAFRREGY